MKKSLKVLILVACAGLLISAKTIKSKKLMQAKGTFEVKLSPADGLPLEKEAGVGRMTIDKTWSGDLMGRSTGAMLMSSTESTGAMAYVALEKVDGELGGKAGSFYFSHTATMKKSDAASGVLKITVVPGSGTGDLAGISGELSINIDAKGAHAYTLQYELP
jgi:hypothetical protein